MKTLVVEGKEVRGTEKANTLKLLPPTKKAEATTAEQKATVSAKIEKLTQKVPPTAEERIGRIEHFEALSKRFKQLKEKANDLKMFDAGNDKTNAKIALKNSSGFEFSVSNSNVIKKVRDAMETELNILLAEAENEVLNFEI
jgi:hypothetical protein